MSSPTSRTLVALRALGFHAEVVEQFIKRPGCAFRRDLCGCIDILAINPVETIVGVQATDETNHAKRVAKAEAEPRLLLWLEAGARFQIWSWGKRGGRGEAKLWTPRKVEATLSGGRIVWAEVEATVRTKRKAMLE